MFQSNIHVPKTDLQAIGKIICLPQPRGTRLKLLFRGKEIERFFPETIQWLRILITSVIQAIQQVIQTKLRTKTVKTTHVVHSVYKIHQFLCEKDTQIENYYQGSGRYVVYAMECKNYETKELYCSFVRRQGL